LIIGFSKISDDSKISDKRGGLSLLQRVLQGHKVDERPAKAAERQRRPSPLTEGKGAKPIKGRLEYGLPILFNFDLRSCSAVERSLEIKVAR
jgi:hypothetical protein